MMGFTVAGAPVISRLWRAWPYGRRVLINVGKSFNLTLAAVLKILFRRRYRPSSSGSSADLFPDQHRRDRVPDQFRVGWGS
jgi:hypothetical protein